MRCCCAESPADDLTVPPGRHGDDPVVPVIKTLTGVVRKTKTFEAGIKKTCGCPCGNNRNMDRYGS